MAVSGLNAVKDIYHGHNAKNEIEQRFLYNQSMGFVTGMIRFFKDMEMTVLCEQNILQDWKHIGSQSCLEVEKIEGYEQQVNDFISSMEQSLNKRLTDWLSTVENECSMNLSGKLLMKTSKGVICVNFDDKLTEIINESHYLVEMGYIDNVPDKVLEIYGKREYLRECVSVLKTAIGSYNQMIGNLIEVEKNLLKEDIQTVENKIDQGLNTIDWEDNSCWDFIKVFKLYF